MRYLGGKCRQRKIIAEHIAKLRAPGQTYLEPFIGGAWVYSEVPGPKIGSDLQADVVELWRAVRDGWQPPSTLSREEHRALKNETQPSALRAFAGFGCSFGGGFFCGYAKTAKSTGQNYVRGAHRSILRKAPGITGSISCMRYDDHAPHGCIIYCDPPYAGTTGYSGAKEKFDHEKFWRVMKEWARDNVVLVTEYTIPDDVKHDVLHSFNRAVLAGAHSGKGIKRAELLVRVHA